MRVTLISPYPDITAFGIRTLSAWLRLHGHSVQIVFLPDPSGDDLRYGVDRYAPATLAPLVPLCQDSALVGVSLMTNHFDGAAQITRVLRAGVKAPIIWGGIHPTIRPDECLAHADYVCIGEGEESLLALVRKIEAGGDGSNTPGIWMKRDGAIQRTALQPLVSDLDAYPAPDYDLQNHHILFEGSIRPMTEEIQRICLERGTVSSFLRSIGYQTLTGRGCPHQCSYCVNDTVKSMYGSKGYLRWRSVGHVMKELEWVRENLPYVGLIWISDDAFFARPLDNLKEFCRLYKERIGFPFCCLASPPTVTAEKMDLLVDAGMVALQMGIQTASDRIRDLFNRKHMTNERTMEAIRTINRYKDRMAPPRYDFILDVPYETDEDRIASLRFIAGIPKPFRLQPFSLVLYPGTKLHKKAVEDGLLTDEKRQVYSKSYTMRDYDYLNLLYTLAAGGRFPSPLLRALVSRPVVRVMNSRAVRPAVQGFFRLSRRSFRAAKRLLGKA